MKRISSVVLFAVPFCLMFFGLPIAPAQETAAGDAILLEYKTEAGTFRRFTSFFETQRRHEEQGTSTEFGFERRANTSVYTFDVSPDGVMSVCGEIEHQPASLKSFLKNGKPADPADRANLESVLPKAGRELVSYRTNKWGAAPDATTTDDLAASVIRSLSAVEQLPDKPVRPGDKWTREETFGLLKCRYDFVFSKVEERLGFACALIEGVLKLECAFVRPGTKAQFEDGVARMWFAVKEGMPIFVEGRIVFSTESGSQKEELSLLSRVEFVAKENAESRKRDDLAKQAGKLVLANGFLQDGTLDAAYLTLAAFMKEHPDSPWNASVSHTVKTIETEFPLLLKEAPELDVVEWVVPLPKQGSGAVVPPTPPSGTAGTAPLQSLRGKVVLIDFWATWCPPCKETMPNFALWHATYSSKDLVIIGITACEAGTVGTARGEKGQTADDVRKYVEGNKIKYSIGIEPADRATSKKYRVFGIPHSFLVDRAGKVRWQGHPGRKERLEAMIQKLLQE